MALADSRVGVKQGMQISAPFKTLPDLFFFFCSIPKCPLHTGCTLFPSPLLAAFTVERTQDGALLPFAKLKTQCEEMRPIAGNTTKKKLDSRPVFALQSALNIINKYKIG